MNEQLLAILGIDKGLGLDDMIEALEEKYCEYLEREQTATSPERQAEIADTIKKIEAEIQNLKENKKSINSAIILDTGDTPAPAAVEKPAKKAEDENKKIAAMKQKKAELKAEQQKKKAAARQYKASSSAPTQPAASVSNSSTNSGNIQLTGDDYQDAVSYFNHNRYDKALPLFEKESEKGNKEAQFFLGSMYIYGNGVAIDHDRGMFWLKKSADNGFSPAQFGYGCRLIMESGFNQTMIDESLRYLELAADSNESDSNNAMKAYINAVIEKRTNNKTITKAMAYCDKVIANSTDSFEKDQFQKKKVQLKSIKKSNRSGSIRSGRIGCGSCIEVVLKAIIVIGILLVIALPIINSFKKLEKKNAALQTATTTTTTAVTTPAPVFGERMIELHEISPYEEQCLTLSSGHDYVVDNSIWNGAFVYRAGNGKDTAYALYDIGGCFDKITFEATPWLGGGNFFKSSSADIMLINSETNDVLFTQTIKYTSGVLEIEADISGVNKLGIYVKKTNGMLAYTFIRNVYLYPAGSEPAEETASGETAYLITGNIRSGAGTEFDSIFVADGSRTYIATGNTQTDAEGGLWYEIYTDDDRTATGWCHSSVAVKQ